MWNIFVIQAVLVFNIDDTLKRTGDVYGFLTYGLVIIAGCLLSVAYGKLSEIVAKDEYVRSALNKLRVKVFHR